MPAWRGWSSEGFPSPRPPGPRAKPAAAAAAKLPQSCPTLVRPHRWQPTRLRHPWDSPGKNTGVACHFLLQYMKVRSESEVAQSIRLFPTPWTAAHQAPAHGIFQARVLDWVAIAFSGAKPETWTNSPEPSSPGRSVQQPRSTSDMGGSSELPPGAPLCPAGSAPSGIPRGARMLPSAWGGSGAPRNDGDDAVRV